MPTKQDLLRDCPDYADRLSTLTEAEQLALEGYYGLEVEPLSLDEIGKLLGGISRQAVAKLKDRALQKLRRPAPTPPPPTDFPRLRWYALADMPSQLPVGDYSQYEVAFSRASGRRDGARLYVHAIRGRSSHMGVVTMGFQVSADPVGFAVRAGGEAGFYLDPEMLAWASGHGESFSIPISSYHLFGGNGLPLHGRTWFVGTDALRSYFDRRARKTSERTERIRQEQQQRERDRNRDWFWEQVRVRGRGGAPLQQELRLLGLDCMPATLAELKLAWKEKLRVCHPDVGGSTAQAQEIGAAFERLRAYMERP